MSLSTEGCIQMHLNLLNSVQFNHGISKLPYAFVKLSSLFTLHNFFFLSRVRVLLRLLELKACLKILACKIFWVASSASSYLLKD